MWVLGQRLLLQEHTLFVLFLLVLLPVQLLLDLARQGLDLLNNCMQLLLCLLFFGGELFFQLLHRLGLPFIDCFEFYELLHSFFVDFDRVSVFFGLLELLRLF